LEKRVLQLYQNYRQNVWGKFRKILHKIAMTIFWRFCSIFPVRLLDEIVRKFLENCREKLPWIRLEILGSFGVESLVELGPKLGGIRAEAWWKCG